MNYHHKNRPICDKIPNITSYIWLNEGIYARWPKTTSQQEVTPAKLRKYGKPCYKPYVCFNANAISIQNLESIEGKRATCMD